MLPLWFGMGTPRFLPGPRRFRRGRPARCTRNCKYASANFAGGIALGLPREIVERSLNAMRSFTSLVVACGYAV